MRSLKNHPENFVTIDLQSGVAWSAATAEEAVDLACRHNPLGRFLLVPIRENSTAAMKN
jgi:hypothetical protein